MKKALSVLILCCLLLSLFPYGGIHAADTLPVSDDGIEDDSVQTGNTDLVIAATSALLMDAHTGTVLFAQNADAALPPASVTKIMTLLLVMEAIRDGKIAWDSIVTASERAASMGGSQIYLKVGEEMSVEDLVKSVVIASANDAALALAEYVAGSEDAFVAAMNKRAAELGMTATHFENTNGLDDTVENHVTSAKDIAIMSRALMAYSKILEYSSTWMDTVRDGAFTLTNTNRLIRFYQGATGLKTGSTAKAKFCISATAERDGFSLIAVIMGAETRDERNAEAKKLLDFGFANYGLLAEGERALDPITVTGGVKETATLTHDPFSVVLPKEKIKEVEVRVTLPASVAAPVAEGDEVGRLTYYLDGVSLGSTPIRIGESIAKISFTEVLKRILRVFVLS